MLAMTLAQVAGALPIIRLGRGLPAAALLRGLVGLRALALAAIAAGAAAGLPFLGLVGLAAVAGSVNGAAFALLRSALNELTPASRLPRALGIAATLNETTFVLAPVMASALGSVSPVLAVLALAGLGALPALLVPRGRAAPAAARLPPGGGALLSPAILLWLACAAAGGATVAALEIGAVALALAFGHEPALAIVFTVPLCLAAVAGGLWVSLRNRMPTRPAVLGCLAVMTAGALLAALEWSLATTVLGAVLVGTVLAPLGTHYSLVLDSLAPPQRRAEVFALLRTANALGVIFASALLTAFPLPVLLGGVTGAMLLVTLAVGLTLRRPGAAGRP
jgi:hypothetical protein